jgi:predicted nucleotidyltransferase
MFTIKEIDQYVSDVAAKFNPERVILFGSYATGKATEDSDVDLLVVMKHSGRDVEQAFNIRRSINRRFPLDLVVRTPNEVRHRLRNNDTFLSNVYREGKTLYERRA